MSFNIRNLAVLSYAQGFTLWHYKDDTRHMNEIDWGGFFNDAGDMFNVGDMIMITSPLGAAKIRVVVLAGDSVILSKLSD